MQNQEDLRKIVGSLQAGRGLAALLVVLYHAGALLASDQYGGKELFFGFFGFGYAGIEFFFALSGFIILMVHRRDIGNPHRLRNYFGKRAIRIYPIYWIVTAVCVALYVATNNDRISLIGNSILLVGADTDAILGVAWTLFHEIAFYLIFGMLILNGRIGGAVLAIWFTACILWINGKAPHYLLSSLNLIFLFGMLAAHFYPYVRAPRTIVALCIAAFIGLGLEVVYADLFSENMSNLLFGLVAALGIAAAVQAEETGGLMPSRWLIQLGDASYSLYLVHYPVISLVAKILMATPARALPAHISFCIFVIASIVAGFLMHALLERPVLKLLSTRFRRQQSTLFERGSPAAVGGDEDKVDP